MEKIQRIPTPKMSEFLKDFMEPYHLSAYRLAKAIGVPVSRIQDLLHDRRKMTADTSIRLGRFFHQHDSFFMEIQMELDMREARFALEDKKLNIIPVDQLLNVKYFKKH